MARADGFTLDELRADVESGALPAVVTSALLADWYGVARRYATHRLSRWARAGAMRRVGNGRYELLPRRARTCRRWTGEEVRRMLLLRVQGLAVERIARELGRSRNGVAIALSRCGAGK